MPPVPVEIVRLPHAEGLDLPHYASEGAAGMDLLAAISDDRIIAPGGRSLVPTGLRVGLPTGYELQVRPRSGLALKHGLTLLNTPGTIDEDYRGEIGIIVLNTSETAFTVTRGMRIAQAILAPVTRLTWVEVSELDETARGMSGFGSTGTLKSL